MSFPDCSPRAGDRERTRDEADARLGLRTFNEIRRGRGLEPYADSRFDLPLLGSPSPLGRGVRGEGRAQGELRAKLGDLKVSGTCSTRCGFRPSPLAPLPRGERGTKPKPKPKPKAKPNTKVPHVLNPCRSRTTTLATDATNLAVRCVITTVDPDRSGDVIVPTGLKNLEEYLLNPVVLWAHDRFRVPPIGTCEWLDVQPRRVVAETRFAEGVAFAEDVFELYDHGVLRGWSIGFVPRKAHRTPTRSNRSATGSTVISPRCTSTSGTCSNTRPCRSPRTPGP